MNDILEKSWLWQTINRWLAAFASIYHKGLIAAFSATFSRQYKNSQLKKIWIGFCEAPYLGHSSRFMAFLDFWRRVMERFGDVLRHSLFYRLVASICRGYLLITKHSWLFSKVNAVGLHRWLLIVFALYLPIEYVIRDYLGLLSLASIWEELLLIVVITYLFWQRVLKQTTSIKRDTPLDMFIIMFMAIGFLLMSLVSPDKNIALAGYRIVVEYMLWFSIIIRLIQNEDDFKLLYSAILAMAFLLSLHGIYQYVIGVPIPSSWTTSTEMSVRTRVFSLTGSPNIFGSLIVMTAPLAAALVYYCRKNINKIFFVFVTLLMCLCLLFTFSRGAWVGMIVAVVIFALFVDKRLIVILGAAMATVLAFIPSITSRITFLFTSEYAEASAVGGRALRWATGKLLLSESNPWLGFGLGRFGGAVAMNNKVLEETEEFSYFYMDNYYLKTLVEMGVIGLVFYLILLIALLIWGVRAIHRSDARNMIGENLSATYRNVDNPKVLAVGIFSGLVGVLVHCYFENIFEEPYMTAYFWGLAALLIYCGFFRKRKENDNSG